MNNIINISGRVLLGGFFIMAGLSKLGAGYAGTAGYMDSMGISSSMLPLVILLEIAGGALLITGLKVKWASAALAGFAVVAGIIFHSNFSDQIQMILFMKNIAIAGGLLLLTSNGAGQWSLDSLLNKQ